MKLRCYTVIWTYEQYTHIHPNQAHQTLHFPKIDNVYFGLQELLSRNTFKMWKIPHFVGEIQVIFHIAILQRCPYIT